MNSILAAVLTEAPGGKAERSTVVGGKSVSPMCLFRKAFLHQMTLKHVLKF